jgi:Tol biopolymer transport system component
MRARVALGAAATLLVLFPSGAVGGRDAGSVVWFVGSDAPAWSPDGKLIAFTAFRGGRVGDIYVMRPDGTRQRNLTRSPAHEDLAAWSPDGTKIAYTTNRDKNDEIYVMNANGTGQKRLTHAADSDYAPSWSPDGRKIVFWTTRHGSNNEIYSINADGTGETRLTTNPASDHSPSWGPDGRIVFVTSRGTGGRTTIYMMNADGSDQRQLSAESASWNESRPVWSPDGNRIAFVSGRDFPVDNIEIYVMNADGTRSTRITRSPLRDDWPTWSPDGTKIAFAHGSLFHPEVYRVNVAGGGLRLLSRKAPVLETRFLTVPDPHAGERFTVTLGILTGTGAPVRGAHPFCTARLGGKALMPLSRTFAASRARCSWALPRSAREKRLDVTIGARLGSSAVSETFQTRVF